MKTFDDGQFKGEVLADGTLELTVRVTPAELQQLKEVIEEEECVNIKDPATIAAAVTMFGLGCSVIDTFLDGRLGGGCALGDQIECAVGVIDGLTDAYEWAD